MQNDYNSEYFGNSELVDIENNLGNYNRFIVGLFAEYLQGIQTVVDFGAGISTLSQIFASITDVCPVCVELDEDALSVLKDREFKTVSAIEDVPFQIDGLFTSNVLEHIEDDRAILEQIHSKMATGARLAIYVPAFMCLFSDMDRKVGHYRRNEKQELVRKVSSAGFKIGKIHYVDSIGFVASILLVLKVKFRTSEVIEMPVSGSSMKLYDRFVFPLSRLADRIGFRFLFGKTSTLKQQKFESCVC